MTPDKKKALVLSHKRRASRLKKQNRDDEAAKEYLEKYAEFSENGDDDLLDELSSLADAVKRVGYAKRGSSEVDASAKKLASKVTGTKESLISREVVVGVLARACASIHVIVVGGIDEDSGDIRWLDLYEVLEEIYGDDSPDIQQYYIDGWRDLWDSVIGKRVKIAPRHVVLIDFFVASIQRVIIAFKKRREENDNDVILRDAQRAIQRGDVAKARDILESIDHSEEVEAENDI